jgi:hypothetical protein
VSVEGDSPVTLARLLVKVLVITALYTVDVDLGINLNSLP